MSSEGLPVNNVVGTSVDLGARNVQDAANSASSSQNADSAAASADAAWKFSRVAQGAAGESATAVSDAEAAAAAAAEAAQNATIAANLYPSVMAAQAAITAGTIPLNAMFNVAVPAGSTPPRFADQYQNVAGVATATGVSYPSQESLNSAIIEVTNIISNDSNVTVLSQWESDGGFILAQLDENYLKTAWFEVGSSKLLMSATTMEDNSLLETTLEDGNGFILERRTSSWFENVAGKFIQANNGDYVLEDENGFHVFSALKSGSDPQNDNEAERDAFIANMDNAALANSMSVNNKLVTGIQRPVFDYNLVVTYGQSLSTGTEGWPALSKTAIEVSNVLMFGNAVRPSTDRNTGGSTWSPLGGAALNPLIAVTQDIGGGSVLTAAQEAALAPGAVNEGETFDVGAVNFWRKLQNDLRGISVNPDRKLIVLNCGVQGRTVEELSKGNPMNHYNRVIEAVTKVKAYINSQFPSATVGITSFLYAQGEWNYWTATSGTHDRATFLALTKQLRTDLINDCAFGICGQSLPPAWITYQTGGSYTDDTYNLGIGMAQIDMADTVPGCWLATPVYQVTDKNGHLDPNGYRWAGMQFGKVMHRILDRGIDWKPLKPIKAVRYSNDEILVNFLTPSPPLRFNDVYVVNTATMYPNKGFLVKDASGVVGVASVSIVGQSTISIKLSAATTGDVYLWYAPKTTFNGNGNLCDSDSTIAPYNYEYHAGSGQYASANIAALVDKPYPLNNWCVAFRIQVEEV